MADNTVKIRVEIAAKLEELKKLQDELVKVESAVKGVRTEASKPISLSGGTNTGAGLASDPATIFGDPAAAAPAADPLYEIFDEPQRKAVEDAVKALKAFRDALPETSDELADLDRQIGGLEASLKGAGAQQLLEIKALEAQARAAKAAGHETKTLDDRIRRLKADMAGAQPPILPMTRWQRAMASARAQLTALGNHVPVVGRAMNGMGGAAGALAAGPLAALAVGAMFAKQAFDALRGALQGVYQAFTGMEDALARQDIALAQTGQLTDAHREKIKALADELQSATNVASTEWLGVLTKLTQHGAPVEELDTYSTAVKNLAGLLGGDVPRAGELITRAMGGQFTEFRRLGITISDVGTEAQKLEMLFQQLATAGGGQLEGMTKTLSGNMGSLKLAIQDVAERLGLYIDRTTLLRPTLRHATLALETLNAAFDWLGRKVRLVMPSIDGLQNSIRRTKRTQDDATDSATRHTQAMEGLRQRTEEANAQLNGQRSALDLLVQTERKLITERTAQEKKKLEIARINGMPEAEFNLKMARLEGAEKDQLAKLEITALQEKKRIKLAEFQTEQKNVEEMRRLLAQAQKDAQALAPALIEKEDIRGQIGAIQAAGLPDDKAGELDALLKRLSVVNQTITSSEASGINAKKLAETLAKAETDLAKNKVSVQSETSVLDAQAKLLRMTRGEERKTEGLTAQAQQAELLQRQERERIQAQIDLLENQKQRMLERGKVPTGESAAITALRMKELGMDSGMAADVRAMRAQDLTEDADAGIRSDFRTARDRTGRVPEFTKNGEVEAARALAERTSEGSKLSHELIGIARKMQEDQHWMKHEIWILHQKHKADQNR